MESADIIIIGSGIACTLTLTEVFNRLENNPTGNKVSITIIEKHHEFWLGIPYGSRSSLNALTITSIYDFFTDEHQRNLFINWFDQNKHEVLTSYRENAGKTAEQWMQRNSCAIENRNWKNVYMPRYIYGKYQLSKFYNALNSAETRGWVNINLLNAEVIDIQPEKYSYKVSYKINGTSTQTIIGNKVVIATGSAPVKDITLPTENNAVTVINDMYEPGATENIKKLASALTNTNNKAERNVLVVGSNASSIELLYLLAGLPDVTNLINKLVVISKSGLLPHHIIENAQDESSPINLNQLESDGNYTIESLIDAAKKDITNAVKNGVVMPYIDKIITLTIKLLQPLDENAKKEFIGIYGMQLSNIFRRSGADYKAGAGLLLELEKLSLLKGSFDNISISNKGGELLYTTTDSQQKLTYPEKFKVVINCTGANNLHQSSSKLIYSLVHNGIAKVNLSGKGFLVNENFEAAPNLYIIGPLLGGNKNARIHFWHLENASRIMYLAPYLAECLIP